MSRRRSRTRAPSSFRPGEKPFQTIENCRTPGLSWDERSADAEDAGVEIHRGAIRLSGLPDK